MKFNRIVKIACVCGAVLSGMCADVMGIKSFSIGTNEQAVSFVKDIRVSMDIYENLVAMQEVTFEKICDEFCKHGICLEELSNYISDLQSNLTSDILQDSYCRIPRIVFSMVRHSDDDNLQKVVKGMVGDSTEYGKDFNHVKIMKRGRATVTAVCCSLLDILKFDVEKSYADFLSEYMYLSELNCKDRVLKKTLQSLLDEWSDKKAACMEREILEN